MASTAKLKSSPSFEGEFKAVSREYFDSSYSGHGIKHVVVENSSWIRRGFWFIALAVCLTIMALQVVQILQAYYSFPKNVNFEVVDEVQTVFPAVTICNMNALDKFKIQAAIQKQQLDTRKGVGKVLERLVSLDQTWKEKEKDGDEDFGNRRYRYACGSKYKNFITGTEDDRHNPVPHLHFPPLQNWHPCLEQAPVVTWIIGHRQKRSLDDSDLADVNLQEIPNEYWETLDAEFQNKFRKRWKRQFEVELSCKITEWCDAKSECPEEAKTNVTCNDSGTEGICCNEELAAKYTNFTCPENTFCNVLCLWEDKVFDENDESITCSHNSECCKKAEPEKCQNYEQPIYCHSNCPTSQKAPMPEDQIFFCYISSPAETDFIPWGSCCKISYEESLLAQLSDSCPEDSVCNFLCPNGMYYYPPTKCGEGDAGECCYTDEYSTCSDSSSYCHSLCHPDDLALSGERCYDPSASGGSVYGSCCTKDVFGNGSTDGGGGETSDLLLRHPPPPVLTQDDPCVCTRYECPPLTRVEGITLCMTDSGFYGTCCYEYDQNLGPCPTIENTTLYCNPKCSDADTYSSNDGYELSCRDPGQSYDGHCCYEPLPVETYDEEIAADEYSQAWSVTKDSEPVDFPIWYDRWIPGETPIECSGNETFVNLDLMAKICGDHSVPCLGSFNPLVKTYRCVNIHRLCDEFDDCSTAEIYDASDETLLCDKREDLCRASEKYLLCDDNTTCVHLSKVCDGANDCGDSSDEKDCTNVVSIFDKSCQCYKACPVNALGETIEKNCYRSNIYDGLDASNIDQTIYASRKADLSDVKDIFRVDVPEVEQFGISSEKFIIGCSKPDGTPCQSEEFYSWKNDAYGTCFTFNSAFNLINESIPELGFRDLFLTSSSGSRAALELVLNVQPNHYMRATTPGKGVRIVIHDSHVIPFPEIDGFNAAPGVVTSVGLKKKKYSRIPEPHGKCAYQDLLMECEGDCPGIQYTYQNCMKYCRERITRNQCQCRNGFHPIFRNLLENLPMCDLTNRTNDRCLQDIERGFLNGSISCGHCVPACEETKYEPVLSNHLPNDEFYFMVAGIQRNRFVGEEFCYGLLGSNSEKDDPLKKATEANDPIKKATVRLSVYLESLTFEQIVESPAMTWETMVSNLGGTFGLFAGLSIISIIELFEYLWILLTHRMRKPRVRKSSQKEVHRVQQEDHPFTLETSLPNAAVYIEPSAERF